MTHVPITLRQGNTETIRVTITPDDPTDDLTLITKLVCVIKPDACTSDSDTSTVTLSSTVSAQILITAQSATSITADVYVPASALASPYDRVWRVDAYVGTAMRTALYGPVTVIDL